MFQPMSVNQRLYDSNIIMPGPGRHGRHHSDGVGQRRPHPQGNSGSFEESLEQRRYRSQSDHQNVARYLKAEPGKKVPQESSSQKYIHVGDGYRESKLLVTLS